MNEQQTYQATATQLCLTQPQTSPNNAWYYPLYDLDTIPCGHITLSPLLHLRALLVTSTSHEAQSPKAVGFGSNWVIGHYNSTSIGLP